MIVLFTVDRGSRPPAQAKARTAILLALSTRPPVAAGELNVVWTNRGRLRGMNWRFRGKNRFTDIIAFRHGPDSAVGTFPLSATQQAPFGDLYIAVDQARLNARRFGVSLDEEIVRLAVHGTLHLLGHTDYTPGPRARMWAVQEPIVRAVMARSGRTSPAAR
ncbi:MAG: rRNA maturation RNase YbeY [Elusimicrobia bacterium]|nr:rRNA maturation RNase YbeY [Elusimicrobiota bacterium]